MTESLCTVDVSFSGLFLSTPTPPPLRELVKIRITDPWEHLNIRLMGMAVHVVRPMTGRQPGVGVQLYGNDPKTMKRWEHLVAQARDHGESIPAPEPVEAPKLPEYFPDFRVKIPSLEALEIIRNRDIAHGKTFVQTEVYLEVGTDVGIHFIHPITERVFSVKGSVLKVIHNERIHGLGVALLNLDEERKREFSEYADDHTPTISVDLVCSVGDYELSQL